MKTEFRAITSLGIFYRAGKFTAKILTFACITAGIAAPAPVFGAPTEDSITPEGMVLVQGGCFEMGSNTGELNEKPVHRVCLDAFYLDMHEVTQDNFQRVTGKDSSYFKGCPACPAEQVNWNDARTYCEKEGKRLPTEAEWEYAARSGGQPDEYAGTNDEELLGDYAWFGNNSDSKTNVVGQKKPNGLNLYDLSGNVWEWVADWYEAGYYQHSPEYNPTGPENGGKKVLRGGSWFNNANYLRTTNRGYDNPSNGVFLVGFRCAR